MKKYLLLILCLVSSLMASAKSGTCGANLTWSLEDGILVISGTGAMTNYSSKSNAPWYSSRSTISLAFISEGVTSIGEYAFYNCSSLTSITIPNSVTSIGQLAFANCSGLTSVTIGNSVKSIGRFAFLKCSRLTSINIPNSVTSIGDHAFSECSGLTSVTIGNSVKSIGESAFFLCSGLTSITIPNSVTSIGSWAFAYCSSLTSITIPNSVTSIGSWAFEHCSGLTSVTIPNSVTSIGENAFEYCSGLTSVRVLATTPPTCGSNLLRSAGTSTIHVYKGLADAYREASGWSSYTIVDDIPLPGSVTISVSADAEKGSVTGAGEYTEGDEVTLTATPAEGYKFLRWSDGSTENPYTFVATENKELVANFVGTCGANLTWSLEDGILVISGTGAMTNYSSSSRAPWYSFRSTISIAVIGEGVTSIGNDAFAYCSALTSVIIPNSVTSIGTYAFSSCSGLTSITIPNSVTSIKYYAFHCSGLTSVTIPNSVTSIGDCAFCACSDLTSVIIPNSVTNLGIGTFWHCSSLTSITIPNSVKNIGYQTFYNCSSLTSVTIPNSVTSIGDDAFYGCSGLTSVTIPNSVTSIEEVAFRGCSGLTSVTIPNSVTSIGNSAFAYCSSLTSVIIPNSVTSIGTYAFSSCSGLTSITIPNSVTSIKSYAFHCSGLTSVTIPNSVTNLGGWAFCACSDLTSVIIPNSVTNLGDGTFWHCSSLTSITIPNSVKNIGYQTFINCSSLTSITIPNSVTSIGQLAFANCSGLTSVTIPNSVTSIGDAAFSGCSGLTSVKVLATTPPTCGSDLLKSAGTSTIHVYEGLADAYREASGWSSYTIVDDVPGAREDYHVNFDKNIQRGDYSTEHPNRWLESFTLNGETVTMNTNHQPYQDMTSTEIVLCAGQQVSVDCKQWNTATYQYTNPWMHGYIYIDEDQNGRFDYTVDNEAHTINGELKSYSYYSFTENKRTGWNSKGEQSDWGTSIVPPSFTAPTVPGTYRLRFKTDWNDPDPAGSVGSENSVTGVNGILTNSGCIVDITVRVIDNQLVDGNVYEINRNANNVSFTYTRTFNNTEWQALYVPFRMSYEDWCDEFEVAQINMFHQYDTDEDGTPDDMEMEIFKVKSGTLKQNHPYLIRAKEVGEHTLTLTDATLYAAEENSYNCSSMNTNYTFTGTYAGMSGADMYANNYYSMGGGALINAEDDTADLKPYRWYLQMTDREGQVIPAPSRIRVMVWDGQTTGVESLSQDNNPTRAISIDGRSVKSMKARGLYIVNGKKVLR